MQEENKRVARNTIMLYIRMFVYMIVSLYTSRLVLKSLGIEDYGIRDVVGGVVGMFGVLNASIATATSRYITFSLGKKKLTNTKKVFSSAVVIHFIIAIVVLILCETIGLWFLNHKLVIPESRLFAANGVFQVSLLSLFLYILQVPYNALITAHEKMDVYAYISIFDVVAKLLIVYLIVIIPYDRLITYAVLGFIVSLLDIIIYRIYCRRKFVECRFSFSIDKSLFKDMFQFAGWNFLGSIAWMLRDQGVNIVLNLFMGPVVNAARGVAMQVSGSIQGLSNNFTMAVVPQITKNYASGAFYEMEILAYRGAKFAFLLLFFLAFPLMLNIDFVLELWLSEVPANANIFIILVLIDAMSNSIFSTPFITSLMATGNIRNYQILVSVIILCIVPVGYILLKLGYNVVTIFLVMIFFTTLSGFVRYAFCVKQIGYQWTRLFRFVIIPLLLFIIVCIPIPLLCKHFIFHDNSVYSFVFLCLISLICDVISALYIGMTTHERQMIMQYILKKIK